MKKKHLKNELIMLAISKWRTFAIFWSGKAVEYEFGENINEYDMNDYFPYPPGNPPKSGIFIWEGIPKAIGSGEDFEGFDFDKGIIREPTEWEWHCLKLNESPWPAQSDYGQEEELTDMIDEFECFNNQFTDTKTDYIKCILLDGEQDNDNVNGES